MRWYFGKEMPETMVAVTRKRLMVLSDLGTDQELERYVEGLRSNSAQEVVLLKRSIRHNNNEDQVRYIFRALEADKGTHERLEVGVPRWGSSSSGVLQEEVQRFLRRSCESVAVQDGAAVLTEVMQVKSRGEMAKTRRAGGLACYLMRRLMLWVEQCVDRDEKVRHANLARRVESFMANEAERAIMEHHC